MDKEQAQITLEQLGGMNLLKLMIGAKNFTFDSTGVTGLRFKFECSPLTDMLEILLKNDLYTMKFYKIPPLMIKDGDGAMTVNPEAEAELKPVKIFEGVENNQLVAVFEEFTKLSIRPIKFIAA